MSYSYIDFGNEDAWVLEQNIDMDKANDTCNKVLKAQGFLTGEQMLACLCGKSFDEVIDYDVRIWEPKTNTKLEWVYPI